MPSCSDEIISLFVQNQPSGWTHAILPLREYPFTYSDKLMQRHVLFLTLALLLISFGCDSQLAAPDAADLATGESSVLTTVGKNGPPLTATMQVGRNELGTEFFPPGSHDGSFHAKDAFQPGTVVISTGGTVTFNQSLFHSVAIYEPGTTPRDIDISLLDFEALPAELEFPPVIDDPNGRLHRSEVAFPAPKVFTYTFTSPGDYLVICEVLPHFAVAKMYGYVKVR